MEVEKGMTGGEEGKKEGKTACYSLGEGRVELYFVRNPLMTLPPIFLKRRSESRKVKKGKTDPKGRGEKYQGKGKLWIRCIAL